MRKKSPRPKCEGIYKRNRFKINVWVAISSKRTVKFVVVIFLIIFLKLTILSENLTIDF